MSSPRDLTTRLRQSVWNGSIPLEIRLHKADCTTYDKADPYLIQLPRLSYLGFVVDRIHAFFFDHLIHPDRPASEGWLSFQDVPLKWHYPLGLLYDLYSGAEPVYALNAEKPEHGAEAEENTEELLPWRLTFHLSEYPEKQLVKLDADGKHLHDLFINNVKEADFLRNGSGKTIMSLTKEDSEQLWDAVKSHEFARFNPVNQKLLNPQGMPLRHVPIRLYLPHGSPESDGKANITMENRGKEDKNKEEEAAVGSVRVVQRLITPSLSSRQPQTIGTALNQILPTLFQSRRSALLAQPVLHGAALPLTANIEDVLKTSAYLDGWLHIAIVMMA